MVEILASKEKKTIILSNVSYAFFFRTAAINYLKFVLINQSKADCLIKQYKIIFIKKLLIVCHNMRKILQSIHTTKRALNFSTVFYS